MQLQPPSSSLSSLTYLPNVPTLPSLFQPQGLDTGCSLYLDHLGLDWNATSSEGTPVTTLSPSVMGSSTTCKHPAHLPSFIIHFPTKA